MPFFATLLWRDIRRCKCPLFTSGRSILKNVLFAGLLCYWKVIVYGRNLARKLGFFTDTSLKKEKKMREIMIIWFLTALRNNDRCRQMTLWSNDHSLTCYTVEQWSFMNTVWSITYSISNTIVFCRIVIYWVWDNDRLLTLNAQNINPSLCLETVSPFSIVDTPWCWPIILYEQVMMWGNDHLPTQRAARQ